MSIMAQQFPGAEGRHPHSSGGAAGDKSPFNLNFPMKIDVHTHILPEHWPNLADRYGYGGFVRLDHHKPCCARMMIDDRFFREVESNTWDPVARMHECDATQVSMQVLSTVPVMFSYWAKPKDTLDLSMFLNDHIAGIVHEYPDRFIGLGTLPLQGTDLSVKELERCVKDLGLAGIQIGTNINNINLDNPALFPVFEAAQDLGAAIFVHPWEMMGQDHIRKYWLPWLVGMPAETSRAICSLIFGGVFRRLPNLKFCFAHGGGSFPFTIGRIGHGFEVRPDLCAIDNDVHPRDYLGSFFIDTLTHDASALRYLAEVMGKNRITVGSDYPFPLGEHVPGSIVDELGWPAADRDLIYYKNALEWLSLSEQALSMHGLMQKNK